MKLVAVLCLLAAETVHVYAMPNGAPAAACATIQPAGPHVGTNPPNSANMSDNPFRLDLSEFVCPAGVVGYCYNPGQTYQSKLTKLWMRIRHWCMLVCTKMAFICCFFPFLCILAVTLSGTNNEPFRGLLVQGRQVADASPVGAFSSFTSNTRASDCTPAEVFKKTTTNSLKPRSSTSTTFMYAEKDCTKGVITKPMHYSQCN